MSYSEYGQTCVKCHQANSGFNVQCNDCGGELVATPTCTTCGKILPIKTSALKINYCPNCGAKNPKIIPIPEPKTTPQ